MQYSRQARHLLCNAAEKARKLGHAYVGSAHLLIALCGTPGYPGQLLNSFGVQEEKIKEAQSLYKKNVLEKHKQNLEEMIKVHIKHGSGVEVSVNSEGEVENITLTLKGDESRGVNYIVNTLNIPRERIKTVYENN